HDDVIEFGNATGGAGEADGEGAVDAEAGRPEADQIIFVAAGGEHDVVAIDVAPAVDAVVANGGDGAIPHQAHVIEYRAHVRRLFAVLRAAAEAKGRKEQACDE